MATESSFLGLDWAAEAQGDYSTTGQFRFMYHSGADAVTICVNSTANASQPFGILQNDPTSGQAATIRWFGLSKCYAAEAITAGALITCSTDSRALAADTTGQFVVGKANTASTAAGQVIEVFLRPLGLYGVGSTA